MKLRTLVDAPISKGTRVLVRIDSDVDVVGGKILGESAYRLDCALPTLKYLLKKKAVITVMGHRGRPNGVAQKKLSLVPVQKYLEAKLKTKLKFLPNVRFDSREEKNDAAYARELAAGQELFINESFATAHRKHTSTHAITKILPSFVGFQFEKEVEELAKVRDAATPPISLVIGGAKIETKVPLISKFLKRAEHIFIVGAAANAFLVAAGYDVGGSYVDDASVQTARKLLKHNNIFLPVDLMIGSVKGGSRFRTIAIDENKKLCNDKEANLDVGPATLVMMSEMLVGTKTIIWNGPAGKFERAPFHLGTERIARMLARAGRRGARVVAGGGETVTAIVQYKMTRGFSHISTGGGAMLEFLGGASMPVVDVVTQK